MDANIYRPGSDRQHAQKTQTRNWFRNHSRYKSRAPPAPSFAGRPFTTPLSWVTRCFGWGCSVRSFLRRLDEKSTGPAKAAGTVSSMSAARAMFQAKTTRGQASSGGAGKDLWTQHANAIVGIESMGRAGDPTCSKLSTCGLDGRLVVWEIPTLDIDMQALGL
ncbi:unnamed protein product [Ectocarpus sp. 4 AP-2014]